MRSPIAHPLPPSETEADRKERLAWESQAIEEALRSSEDEGTIPFEEIVAWVDSWDTQSELPPPEPRK
jgi:predicted transcriptional regulator